MIFECYYIKYHAMKKLWILIIIPVLMSACSTSKEAVSARKEQKFTRELSVKNAVESRKYIIKLQRLYSKHGSSFDLISTANYIIVDGDKAVISTAYLGRQFDIRPIAAINTRGQAEEYEVTSISGKGKYEVSLKVDNGRTVFDLNLTISKSGTCYASVSSIKIDNVRYSGYLVPIKVRI
jgi:uncharacterized protein YegP (UPF0339 family)